MSGWRRGRLGIEVFLLYIAGPILIYHLVYIEHIPLLRLLPWLLGILVLLLLLDFDRAWLRAFLTFPRPAVVLQILGLFVVCGGALTLYAANVFPQYFLAFPQRVPDLWLRVMILYPVLSVTAQETLFRVLFFHRYAPLFGGHRDAAIFANASLFAFAHAVLFAYRHVPFHWEAVAISFAGGLIFAYRFSQTRSFWAAALEHALYGDLIFTIGLGVFFFTGVANL